MPTIALFNADLKKAILSAGVDDKLWKMGPMPVEAVLDVDAEPKVAKAIEKDPLLQAEVVQKIGKHFEKVVTLLATEMKRVEKEIESNPGHKDSLEKRVADMLKSNREQLIKDSNEKITKTWAKLQSTRAEYKKYKIKSGVKVTLTSASIAASTAVAAAGGYTGAGTIIGIIGIIKSVSSLLQQVRRLAQEAEETQIDLNDTLITVVKNLEKGAKGKTGLKELGAEVIAQLTSVQLPSIKKSRSLHGTFKSKIDGVDVKSHDTAKELNKALKKIEEAQKSLKETEKKFDTRFMATKTGIEAMRLANKLEAKINKAEEFVNDTILKIHELGERTKVGRTWIKTYDAIITELEKEVPGWSIWAQKAAPMVNLYGASATDLIQPAAEILADLATDTKAFDTLLEKAAG